MTNRPPDTLPDPWLFDYGLMWDWCAGAGSWYGVFVSARTRKGSTSESLAQECSAITTTESPETRIIDFFIGRNCR